MHCVWYISAPDYPGYGMRLTFKEFDVEAHKYCLFDYVTITMISNEMYSPRLLAKICNGKGQRDFVINHGGILRVEFKTDIADNRKGFVAEYSFFIRMGRKK